MTREKGTAHNRASEALAVIRERASLHVCLLWIASLAWLLVILLFAGQSGAQSGEVSTGFVSFLQRILPFLPLSGDTAHFIIRKIAHFGVFFVESTLLVLAVRTTFVNIKRATVYALVAMLIIACVSEIEQIIAVNRGPSVIDVLIDFAGALVGAFAVLVCQYIINTRAGAKARAEERVFDRRAKWLCASEFKNLKPVPVFFREQAVKDDLTVPTANADLQNYHMYARRAFRLGAKLQTAELLITADDYYKLYINGEFVAQGPAPGYPSRYYVNRINVRDYLRAGENVIALDVYYQGLINRVWVSGDDRQGFICELRIDDKPVLRSDERFRYIKSTAYAKAEKLGYDTQFTEHFDMREEPSGWKDVGYDDFMWAACVVNQNADYAFRLQPTPTLETRIVRPETETRTETGVIYDFGHEISGTPIIKAKGEAGEKLVIRMGEELNADGSARFEMRCNCRHEHTLTLADSKNDWEMYDYCGFRYIEIIESGAHVVELSARERFYPLNDDACTLESSDESLNAVFALCKNTIRAGVQDSYIDCPTREKGQYSGDLAITSLSHIYLSGDVRLLKKALDDWAHSKFIAPALMGVFPCSLMQEIADYSLLFPTVAMRYYEHTHDTEYLREMYVTCREIIDTYSKYARDDGLLQNVTEAWNLVDWPENLRDDYDFPLTKPVGEGCHNVINAFYVGAVGTTEEIARTLGEKIAPRFASLSNAFNAAFLRGDSGLYADSAASSHTAVHSNILPLFFSIAPEEAVQPIADWLISQGMRTGVYMAFFLLKALSKAGRYDAVYDIMTGGGTHSWQNMLSEGATTLFEAWGKDRKWNTSLCHPWASAPVAVLVEDILGITPDVARGGAWKPHLPAKIESLRMTVPVAGARAAFLRDVEDTTLTLEKGEL